MNLRSYRKDPTERPDRRKRTLSELRGVDLQDACYRHLLDLAVGDTTASDPILPPSTGAQPLEPLSDADTERLVLDPPEGEGEDVDLSDPETACDCGGAVDDRDHSPSCAGWAIARGGR